MALYPLPDLLAYLSYGLDLFLSILVIGHLRCT